MTENNQQKPEVENNENSDSKNEWNEGQGVEGASGWDDWSANAEAFEAASETIALQAELEAAQAENAKMKEAMLRALAEAENTRKRAERQIADGRTFAISGFARELLTVVDNLRRALAAVPEEEQDEKIQNILVGVDMTEKELIKALEKNNVKEVEAEGTIFDPNFHEAMFEIPNPEVPAGTILTVIEPGWKIGERLLRPARVGVAAGGPQAVSEDK
ncbi:MAG: nucleotide exchange factor GrpE [Alphaproteobacteria bacterium]